MVFASVERMFSPQPIHYREALVVAAVGLVVNIVCALILAGAHEHHDHHHHHGEHAHGHHSHHRDHQDPNLRSAYLHVVADAVTSVLAIIALFGGWVVWVVLAGPDHGDRRCSADRGLGEESARRDRQGAARPRDGSSCRGGDPPGRGDWSRRRGNPDCRPTRLAGREGVLRLCAKRRDAPCGADRGSGAGAVGGA